MKRKFSRDRSLSPLHLSSSTPPLNPMADSFSPQLTPHFSQLQLEQRKSEIYAINSDRRRNIFFAQSDMNERLLKIMHKFKITKGDPANFEDPESFYAPTEEVTNLICTAISLVRKAGTHNNLACDASKEITNLDLLNMHYNDPSLAELRYQYVGKMEYEKAMFSCILNEFNAVYNFMLLIGNYRNKLTPEEAEEEKKKQLSIVSIAETTEPIPLQISQPANLNLALNS